MRRAISCVYCDPKSRTRTGSLGCTCAFYREAAPALPTEPAPMRRERDYEEEFSQGSVRLRHHDVARCRFEAAVIRASEKVWRGGGAAFRCFVDPQVREAQPVFAVGAQITVPFDPSHRHEPAVRHCSVDMKTPDAGSRARVDRLKGGRRRKQNVIGCLQSRRRSAARGARRRIHRGRCACGREKKRQRKYNSFHHSNLLSSCSDFYDACIRMKLAVVAGVFGLLTL